MLLCARPTRCTISNKTENNGTAPFETVRLTGLLCEHQVRDCSLAFSSFAVVILNPPFPPRPPAHLLSSLCRL